MSNMATLERPRDVAKRLLADGRVIVEEVSPFRIKATVRDDGALYECGFLTRKWWCACQANGCAHVLAVQLVTER